MRVPPARCERIEVRDFGGVDGACGGGGIMGARGRVREAS